MPLPTIPPPRWHAWSVPVTSWTRRRLVHLGVVAGLVAAAFLERPGQTTFDTKLDLAENPWGFLQRALSLWNPQANFGEIQNQAYGYLFPIGPFFGLGEAVGLPAWVVQRLWTALLLVLAYAGVVAVCRALPLGTRWSRILAGLAYALSPRMITTLGPISAEAMIVALLPWAVLPLLMWRAWGARRAAALSALAIAGMGAANATLTLAVLPLIALVAITRPPGVRLRLAGWWAVSVALACAWWAGALILLGRYSPPFLDYIETAANTTGGIGPSEVVRGATHWVSGIVIGREPWWPAGYEVANVSWLIVAMTLIGAVGLVALLDRRIPARGALLGSAAVGLVILTLGWTGPLSSPLADTWHGLLDGPLTPFRNVHKFDPLVRLPVTIGLAHAVGLILTWRPRRHVISSLRIAAVATIAASVLAPLVAVASVGLRPGPGWDELPQYWRDAAAYVGERDDHARTLVLPSSGFATQVWGRTVDEPLQALAEAPWVSRSQVFLGSAGGARVLEGLDGWLESGRGSPALGDVLARAGIRFVILRADLDRRTAGTPPVAVVRQALDRSGGISRVAEFGPAQPSGAVSGLRVSGFGMDAALPAIEIYEVDEPLAPARLAASEDLAGITGGPESIARLVEDELLAPSQPAVLASDHPDLARRWFITDDLARRERNFGRIRDNLGPVLTDTEPERQARVAANVLPSDADHHQATARYTEVAGVTASTSQGYSDAAGRTHVELGPWSAVDGDPFTAWRTSSGGDPVGQWLRVDFDSPVSLDGLRVTFASPALLGARVEAVDVRTESGVVRTAVAGDGPAAALDIPPGSTRFVQIEVAAAAGQGEIGILELELPGIEPGRIVVAPDDQPFDMRRVSAPHGLSFHRLDQTRGACVLVDSSTRCDPDLPVRGDEPTNLVRGFTTHASATYELAGTVLPRPGDNAQELLEPLGDVSATASSTMSGDPAVAARRGVDANPATSWVADPFDPEPTLRLAWEQRRGVARIRLIGAEHPVAGRPTAVRVDVGGATHDLALVDGWVSFPPVRARELAVTITDWVGPQSYDPIAGHWMTAPPGLAEVEIPGVGDLVAPMDPGASTGSPCGFGPQVLIDGVPVQTRVDGLIRDVVENRPMRWRACGPATHGVELTSGQHVIEVRASDRFVADTAVLRRAGLPPISDSPGTGELTIRRWGSTERVVEVAITEPALLIVPESHNNGWVARAGGETLPSLQIDGWQQAWQLPSGYEGEVELTFAPQRTFSAALSLGGGALVVLAALALIRSRERRTAGPTWSAEPPTTTSGVAASRWPVIGAIVAVAVTVLVTAVSIAVPAGAAAAVRTAAALPIYGLVLGGAILAVIGNRRLPARLPARPRPAWPTIWVTLAFLLVAVQVGWRAWATSQSYFWQDDFVYLHNASNGLSLEYLFQDYGGHLMPGQFLLVWLLAELAPMAWLPAAALVVGLQLIASLLVVRLVRALVGDGPLGLVVVAVYLMSPIVFTASMWWASALQALPLQICMAWALTAHLRYLRTGSRRALASAVLAVVVGCLFWQKAVLIAPMLVAFTILLGPIFTGRGLRELLRRTRWALAGYAGLAAAYTGVLLRATVQEGDGPPSVAEVGALIRYSIIDTFVPSLSGAMVGNDPAAPLLAPTPPLLAVLVSWQVLAIVAVVSILLARWRAVGAWLFVLGYVLVDVALVATARIDFVGPVIGRDPRYLADAVLVAAVALAGIGMAIRSRRHRLPRSVWNGRAAIASVTVLQVVNLSLLSTHAVVSRLPMGEVRAYVATARAAAAAIPAGVDLVNGPVPESVMAGIFVDRAVAKVVVGAAPEQPRFYQPTQDLRMLDGFGRALPVDIRTSATATADGVPGSCGWSVRNAQVEFSLDNALNTGRWVVRIGYLSGAPTTGRLEVGGTTYDVELHAGVHHLYVELAEPAPIDAVSLGGLPPGDAVCVTDVIVGTAWPRQDP